MALTVTIAGTDVTSQYVTDSFQKTERLQNRSNSASFSIRYKSGATRPVEGSSVLVVDGARKLFAGFVSQLSPTETGVGNVIMYDVEATDYTYVLNNREAQVVYNNKTLKYIAEDLLTRYASDHAFDTTNIATGPTIDTVTFDHITLRACFEKLAKITGYVWYIDYDKNVYFNTSPTISAPEDLRDSNTANHEWVEIKYDTSQVSNVVRVIGSDNGEASASQNVQTFTADGETRSWELEDKPDTVIDIKLNGVSQQYSLDLNERDTDVFVYSFSAQQLRMAASATTPANLDSIEITYIPRVPIIVECRDAASIAFFATLEGGTGEHFKTIRDSSVTSKAEARAVGDSELEEYADALANGRFKTRSTILGAGNIFEPGQALTVNMPSWNLSSDTVFLVQEVVTRVSEGGASVVYNYDVRFGGKVVGIEEFLQSLIAKPVDTADSTSGTVKTIYGLQDIVTLEDNTPTKTNITPHFEYGPAGSPQGKWNLSEWS